MDNKIASQTLKLNRLINGLALAGGIIFPVMIINDYKREENILPPLLISTAYLYSARRAFNGMRRDKDRLENITSQTPSDVKYSSSNAMWSIARHYTIRSVDTVAMGTGGLVSLAFTGALAGATAYFSYKLKKEAKALEAAKPQ